MNLAAPHAQSVSQAAVHLKGVWKSYSIAQQRIDALRGVDLQISHQRIVAVTGKSGAGKSTLLHVIGTLDRATQGDVIINGTAIAKLSDASASSLRNSTVGFIFQMNNLLPEFTALENVMLPGLIAGMPRAVARERAASLLGSVGLGAREMHRPGELSGGEQQRVAIARALVMAPPLLLADEPTGNLDQKTSHSIQELLFELCRAHQTTMLLVTHDLDLAKRLPHQVIMEDGRILEGHVI
jgi:lipoprotein-releasing system ATP-binding protein